MDYLHGVLNCRVNQPNASQNLEKKSCYFPKKSQMSIETHHMTQAVQTLLKERALMEGKGEKEDMVSQGAETAKMVVNDVRKTQEQAAEMEKEKAKDKW